MRADPEHVYNLLLGHSGEFIREDSVLKLNNAMASRMRSSGQIPPAPLVMVTGGNQQTVYPMSTAQGGRETGFDRDQEAARPASGDRTRLLELQPWVRNTIRG